MLISRLLLTLFHRLRLRMMTKRLLFFPVLCLLSLSAFTQAPDPALLQGTWRRVENGQTTTLDIQDGGRYQSAGDNSETMEEGFYRLNRQFLAFYNRMTYPKSAADPKKEALPLPDEHFSYKVIRLDAQYLELEDPRDQSRVLYERKSE